MSAIISEIPSASAVIGSAEAVVSASQEEVMDLTGLIAQVKSLESSDLFKLMKTMLAEAEKKTKSVGKPVKAAAKKAGSQPKGVVPPQLRLPKAWVTFVQEYCNANGWESFVVSTTKKDKVTGETITEEIEMPASEVHNEVHVFVGSVTAAQPKGKALIQKDAMSLSKQMWSAKEKKGTHEALYNEFLASYTDTIGEEVKEVAKPVKPKVVRKTAAEKEAAAEEKKLKQAEDKAEKAKRRAEEKEKTDAEKEAKKAKAAAEKEAKQAKAAAEKEASPKAAKPAKKVATPAKEKPAEKPVAPAAPVKAKPAAKKVEAWTCPADGAVYPWTFKGKAYMRNSDSQVWEADGTEAGDWAGVYDAATDSIDDSAEEPEFD